MVALTNTWNQKEDLSPFLFRSKQDSIITGRRRNIVRGGEGSAMTESAYADDAAFLFPFKKIAERDTPRITKHYTKWGMEFHSGITETPDIKGKKSKTELLFVAKQNNSYTKPSTHDDINISLIILEEVRFILIVNVFWLPEIVVDDLSQVAEFVDDEYEAYFL